MPHNDQTHPSPAELADLSALADGTLAPARAAEVQTRIASSPELSDLYGRELAAVELIRRSSTVDRAPARLRARVEAQRERRTVRVGRRRAAYGLVGATAAVLLVLALVLPSGTPGSPSISQAAALGLRSPAQVVAPIRGDHLPVHVQNLVFPNWAPAFGWRAVGQRTDRINGREAVTVFYASAGRRVAYVVVASPVLAEVTGDASERSGYRFRTLKLFGRTVVTWRRAGHTCVLIAAGVPASELTRLAAWG